MKTETLTERRDRLDRHVVALGVLIQEVQTFENGHLLNHVIPLESVLGSFERAASEATESAQEEVKQKEAAEREENTRTAAALEAAANIKGVNWTMGGSYEDEPDLRAYIREWLEDTYWGAEGDVYNFTEEYCTRCSMIEPRHGDYHVEFTSQAAAMWLGMVIDDDTGMWVSPAPSAIEAETSRGGVPRCIR